MAPDITGPAVETSSERIGKADGNWDTLDSKILEHLVRKKCCVKQFRSNHSSSLRSLLQA